MERSKYIPPHKDTASSPKQRDGQKAWTEDDFDDCERRTIDARNTRVDNKLAELEARVDETADRLTSQAGMLAELQGKQLAREVLANKPPTPPIGKSSLGDPGPSVKAVGGVCKLKPCVKCGAPSWTALGDLCRMHDPDAPNSKPPLPPIGKQPARGECLKPGCSRDAAIGSGTPYCTDHEWTSRGDTKPQKAPQARSQPRTVIFDASVAPHAAQQMADALADLDELVGQWRQRAIVAFCALCVAGGVAIGWALF